MCLQAAVHSSHNTIANQASSRCTGLTCQQGASALPGTVAQVWASLAPQCSRAAASQQAVTQGCMPVGASALVQQHELRSLLGSSVLLCCCCGWQVMAHVVQGCG
jgi:hypothetical protein